MKHVYTHADFHALCDIADEVDRIFGVGATSVALSPRLTTIYVDDRFPTWERAFQYARELIEAAWNGRAAYAATIRR